MTGPCTQLIAAGTKVTQDIKLGASPCKGKESGPAVPARRRRAAVTSFIAPGTGGAAGTPTTVGEYLQAPIQVNTEGLQERA